MKRLIAIVGLVGLVGLPALYLANPTGTASTDARARLLGYVTYHVPTDSNAPTILIGDIVNVSTLAYMLDEPRSGDLIAFLPPGISRPWLKRVIGNPGDTISLVRGRLYINGSTVDEPYVADANNALPCDLQERVVPDGMLFVLGDNRDRSKDSRHFGFIPRVNVIGKVTGS